MLDLALQRLEPAPVLGMPAGLVLVSAWIGERVPGAVLTRENLGCWSAGTRRTRR